MNAYNALSRPMLFGKLAPTGTGDTFALRLTANLETAASGFPFPFGNSDSSMDLWLNKLEIKANAGNGGRIFLCVGVPPYNEATTFINGGGTTPVIGGVIRAIDPGESWSLGDQVQQNVFHAGLYFIVIETAGDYCSAMGDPR